MNDAPASNLRSFVALYSEEIVMLGLECLINATFVFFLNVVS